MDLGVQEYTAIFAIGGIILYVLGLLFKAYLGFGLKDILWTRRAPTVIFAVAIIALSYGIGTVVDVVTVGSADGDPNDDSEFHLQTEYLSGNGKFKRRATEIGLFYMPSETELRFTVLFGDDGFNVCRGLSLGLATSGVMSRYAYEKGTALEQKILSNVDRQNALCTGEVGLETDERSVFGVRRQALSEWGSDEELADLMLHTANAVYYAGKNRLFMEPTYYDELRKIQLRIDFVRSLALITLFIFIPATVILGMIAEFCRHVGHTIKEYDQAGNVAREYEANTLKIFFISFFALQAVCFLFIKAYEIEEREFNRRVYGYVSAITDGSSES